MFKAKLYLFWVIITFSQFLTDVCSVQRQIVIYNSENTSNATFWVGSTNSIPSIEHMPDLINADKVINCYEGVWAVHTEAGYEGLFTGLKLSNSCDAPHAVYYTSFRALSSTDTSTSTVSLFESINLKGNMTQYTADVPYYTGAFRSLVVTDPGELTVYTLSNYGGLSICLTPFATVTHYTYDTASLGIESDSIKSFKFGCDSKHVFYSSNSSMSNSL